MAKARHGRAEQARKAGARALYRLLSDSALARAALGACGFPLAMLDARAGARPVNYVNAAFEEFFGYGPGEALGRPLADLLFRGDEPLAHRLLAESGSRWKLRAWGRDGAEPPCSIQSSERDADEHEAKD